MYRLSLLLGAVLLLVVNGALHGLWTQRWSSLTEPAVQAAGDKLAGVPRKVGNWDGHPLETDEATLSEEKVGRNVTVRYVHRGSGNVVVVYLACGHTPTMAGHTPLECYPAHGYSITLPETRVRPLPELGSNAPELWVAGFSKEDGPAPVHLRIFWAWGDSGPWRAPDNLGRTFRASPFLYKIYAIRQLTSPDEPLEGDPCADLFRELIPELSRALAGNP
jgi:hypothetical protein